MYILQVVHSTESRPRYKCEKTVLNTCISSRSISELHFEQRVVAAAARTHKVTSCCLATSMAKLPGSGFPAWSDMTRSGWFHLYSLVNWLHFSTPNKSIEMCLFSRNYFARFQNWLKRTRCNISWRMSSRRPGKIDAYSPGGVFPLHKALHPTLVSRRCFVYTKD